MKKPLFAVFGLIIVVAVVAVDHVTTAALPVEPVLAAATLERIGSTATEDAVAAAAASDR